MSKPDAVGRMVQWAVKLSQFDIEYRPRTAIKVQALTGFNSEFTNPNPNQEAEYWTICTDGSFVIGLGGIDVIMTSQENNILQYGV